MFLKNFIKPIEDTIPIDATIQDAVDLMSQNKLHRVIIIQNKKAVAILSEKDIVTLFKNNIDFSTLAIDYANKELITLHSTRFIQYALTIMVDNNIRKIIVINSKNEYIGCVEQEEIVYRFEEELHSTNTDIKSLCNETNQAIIIDENKTLQYALNMMTTNRIISLLISKDKKTVGIISESDIVSLAQQHIDQKEPVSKFMHTPVITISSSKKIAQMIELMKSKKIRKVVVIQEDSKSYHIINSKDLANNIKGNYTQFLESKLFDTRDTFNTLSEAIIELIDLDDEQVIYWTNRTTKEKFNVNIDNNIIQVIPQKIWDPILNTLLHNQYVFQTIQLGERYFNLKGHYGTLLENNIIKLFLFDITDITNLNNTLQKQNELQEKLLFEQQKMVQMGEMIGNIAHQWRQPLSNISISASTLQLQKDLDDLDDEDFSEHTSNIMRHVEYLSKTIDTFQNFLKEKKEEKTLILETRIQNALTIIHSSLKNNFIELINNIDFKVQTPITMFVGELDQVIINIINNAKDALQEKKIDNPWIEINLTIENDTAILSIEDNAGGIPNGTIEHIFDEYFTTKDSTKGTGLGLYMSYKIIKESFNGKLYVTNTSNGAKFFIEIPLKNN